MTPEEKHSIREKIEHEISQLRKDIGNLRDQVTPVSPSSTIGRLTRMDAIQQKSMAEANLQTAESSLAKLEQSLDNIDSPDFGTCAGCGNPIPAARILAVPEARLCVNCASSK